MIDIVVEQRRQLPEALVLGSHKLAAVLTMVVEMLHTIARYVETHAQIGRAQYALHVGNGCEVLGYKSAV